jgi:hypothetical protein
MSDDVRRAYYRATARAERREGGLWPLLGSMAVHEQDGTVHAGFNALGLVATWSRDSWGRVRLRLIV